MKTLDATRTLVQNLDNPKSLAYLALAHAIVGNEERAEALRAYSRKLSRNRASRRETTLA